MHLAMKPPGEPVLKTRLGLPQIDIADASLLKTERLAPFLYTGRKVLQVRLSVITDCIQWAVPQDQSV